MTVKKNKLIFKNFEELSTNAVSEDVELAKEFLIEFGIDPDDEAKNGINLAKKTHFLAQAHENQARDSSLLEKLEKRIKESIRKNAELTGSILKEALRERKASFQFRNLENWTDEEIRDVLTDIDLIKLLDDLDNIQD